MKRAATRCLMVLLLLVLQSCASVPYTQRKALIPPSLERAKALQGIAQKAMAEYRKVPNPYGKGKPLF
jgi:hypothetical protein